MTAPVHTVPENKITLCWTITKPGMWSKHSIKVLAGCVWTKPHWHLLLRRRKKQLQTAELLNIITLIIRAVLLLGFTCVWFSCYYLKLKVLKKAEASVETTKRQSLYMVYWSVPEASLLKIFHVILKAVLFNQSYFFHCKRLFDQWIHCLIVSHCIYFCCSPLVTKSWKITISVLSRKFLENQCLQTKLELVCSLSTFLSKASEQIISH